MLVLTYLHYKHQKGIEVSSKVSFGCLLYTYVLSMCSIATYDVHRHVWVLNRTLMYTKEYQVPTYTGEHFCATRTIAKDACANVLNTFCLAT